MFSFLQELFEDRQQSGMNQQQSPRCRCDTADSLAGDLKRVEAGYGEAIDLQDKIAVDQDLLPLQVGELITSGQVLLT